MAAVHVPGVLHMAQKYMERVARRHVHPAIMWKIAHVLQRRAVLVNIQVAIHVQIVLGCRIMPRGPVLEQRQQIAHGNATVVITRKMAHVFKIQRHAQPVNI